MADHPYIEAALAQARYEVAQQAAQDYAQQQGENIPSLGATVAASQPLSYNDYLQWINRNNLPAYRASGAHYSPAGAREGYEDYNLPPVIHQRNPFATAAFRTFVDPFGQMMVQPLVGFPSAYPHVLSGVPTDFTNGLGWAMSLLGPLPQMPARPMMPAAQQVVRQGGRAAAPARQAAAAPAATPAPAPAAQAEAPVQQDIAIGPPRPGRQDPLEPGSARLVPPVTPMQTAPNVAALQPPVLPYVDDAVNYDPTMREDSNPVQDFYDFWGNLWRSGGVDPGSTWDETGFVSPQPVAPPPVQQLQPPVQQLQPPVQMMPSHTQQVPIQTIPSHAPQVSVPAFSAAPVQYNAPLAMRPSAINYYG